MATSAIRTISVAPESGAGGFANIDSTTGAPTTVGLTYVGMECERANITTFGEPVLQQREDARAGPHAFSPEYETAVVSGARAVRLQGTLEVSMVLRTLGDTAVPGAGDFTTYTGATGIPWVHLMNSMWAEDAIGATGNLSDNVAAAAVSANEWTPTLVGSFGPGQMVSCVVDDRIEWSGVTDDPANVIASPAFSRSLDNVIPDVVRLGRTYYPPNDLSTGRGPSVSVQLDGDGFQWFGFGGRAESMKLSLRGRMVMATFTLRFAHIEPGSSPAATDFRAALGSVGHLIDSYVVYSTTTAPVDGNAAPVQLARSTLPVEEFEFTATQPLVARGTPENLVGVAEWEVGADPSYEMTMTVSAPDSTIENDLVDMNARSMLVGFGPHGTGEGACVYMPAARMTVSPFKRDLGNGIVRQQLSFVNGRWWGDDQAAAAPASSSVRIGLSR